MNIKARINSRKAVLAFIYQHCFFSELINLWKPVSEALFIDYVFETDWEKFNKAKEELMNDIKKYSDQEISNESLTEFISDFFWERQKIDVDYDYLFQVWGNFIKYIDEIKGKVNSYTTTFKFDEMDMIDRCLFVLGYTEHKELKTPKEVLLNEIIEISKRYSDEGSPKLLNGIMHKVLSE